MGRVWGGGGCGGGGGEGERMRQGIHMVRVIFCENRTK